MSQIIRIGPQDAKKPISLNPGDLLEVALPEKSVTGSWIVHYDHSLLWDESNEEQQACWVLGGNNQQTVRSLLALDNGSCLLRFDYLDMDNGQDRMIDSVEFEILIGPNQPRPKKSRASEKVSAAAHSSRSSRLEGRTTMIASTDTQSRIQQLELENRRLQERLLNLSHKVVELAEGYAAIAKSKTAKSRT